MVRYNSEVNMWVPFVVSSTVEVPQRDNGYVLLRAGRLMCQGIGKLLTCMLGEERPNLADIICDCLCGSTTTIVAWLKVRDVHNDTQTKSDIGYTRRGRPLTCTSCAKALRSPRYPTMT